MPKIVDAAARRRVVGDAVLRVVARSGVEGASLRAIAEEADLAIGSVRHYFADHNSVLQFAMEELAGRVAGRLLAQLADLGEHEDVDLDTVVSLLAELLPLDESRRVEADVWLAFLTASRTRPGLATIAERLATGLRRVVAQVLAGGARRGLLRFDDPRVETERLAALLDGLTLAVIRPPGISESVARQALRQHLAGLLASASPDA